MSKYIIKAPLEAYTRTLIEKKLEKLGYCVDELKPECNIYRERAKMEYQDELLSGKNPDFLIYEKNTDNILAVIEAKRPSISIDVAREQAIEFYAKPLNIPIIFLFNGNSFSAITQNNTPIKIDNIEITDFVNEETLIKLIKNNFKIDSVPSTVNLTRDDLLKKFKKANDLLREAGLRDGYERFSVFADLLFLKLKNDFEDFGEVSFSDIDIDRACNWQKLISKTPKKLGNKFKLSESEVKSYLEDTIKPKLRQKYGDVFENSLNIKDENILIELIELVDDIPFSQIDSDVKGDAFEFFLKNVTNGNKGLGEYYTPRHIVKMIVQFLNPTYGNKIYDPCCGTGGFLLECYKYLAKNSDMTNKKVKDVIQKESIYGCELTSTARITKMNMILFGDGHSNIRAGNCLKNPISEKFDITVSNIPYSQTVKEGNLYRFNSKKGDRVFIQHLWQATKKGGKMAVIVPDTFLYDGGQIKTIREYIINSSSEFTVVSLPRGVFNPYTPTKTSIIFAKKRTEREELLNKHFNKAYLYVIDNDGFELDAKRKPVDGISDCTKFLMSYHENPEYRVVIPPTSINIDYTTLSQNNFNLFPYLYMEHKPQNQNNKTTGKLSQFIQERNEKFNLEKFNNISEECVILSVTKNGIYVNENYTADEINDLSQNYKKVYPNDFVYNPHRINIGSIGIVPNLHKNMFVPKIYPAFTIKEKQNIPAFYLLKLLKKPEYKSIINHYCVGGARADLKLDWLKKIEIELPNMEEQKIINELSEELSKKYNEYIDLYIKLMN